MFTTELDHFSASRRGHSVTMLFKYIIAALTLSASSHEQAKTAVALVLLCCLGERSVKKER